MNERTSEVSARDQYHAIVIGMNTNFTLAVEAASDWSSQFRCADPSTLMYRPFANGPRSGSFQRRLSVRKKSASPTDHER